MDSIVVEGNSRITAEQIIVSGGIVVGATISYRDVQRAIRALFSTGQFDDVRVEQRDAGGLLVLAFIVKERPVLRSWTLTGPSRLDLRDVRDRIKLVEGRPLDRGALAQSRASIDSMYRKQGYYSVAVTTDVTPTEDGGVRVAFRVEEGNRVAVSRVEFTGNTVFSADEILAPMATKPEGFWWHRSGKYDEAALDNDLRAAIPDWYANRGYVDFRVTNDTLLPDPETGKAILRLTVEEGKPYKIGTITIEGNRRYSTEELGEAFIGWFDPALIGSGKEVGLTFDKSAWAAATERVTNRYQNSGYIYSQVEAQDARRVAADGTPMLDLRIQVIEGQPAYINKVNIVGNDVTHERVIREAIVLIPGALFDREKLIRSYQNVSNLNFFEQPLPFPDVDPQANGDVDITFRVTERRTGNINFGASVGQGTGLGGFLGLEEPNLFGRGKRGRLQWQFGRNINDFSLSYTDPAIKESRISGSVSLFNSRQRFVVGDLGRRRQEGGTVQVGFPFFGSRYSRIFTSYGFQRINFSEGSADLQARFQCAPCSRSTIGLSFSRDVRVGLPFPIAGSLVNVSAEQNGGILGGTGDYQKLDLDTRWFTPLGTAGGNGQPGAGIQFTMGITAKSGFIFGDPGGFFTELYSLGGVQFGIPLRGYDEFSITPNGFDALAAGARASADAFGKSYAAFTVEAGARLSQALYLNAFFDAGNVYRSVRQYDPTRLYRGAGVGAALISPLGPIGVDLGYGFDKVDQAGRPAPGWQLHFRLGNFF